LRSRITVAFMLVVAVAILGVSIAAAIGSQRGIAAVEAADRSYIATVVAEEISRAYTSSGVPTNGDLSGIDISQAEELATASGAVLTLLPGNPGRGPADRGRGPATAPVIVDDQVVGVVRLSFARPLSDSGQSIAWTWIIVAMTVTGSVAALAAWLLSRWLTRPLTQLSHSVRAFGKGDRTVRAPSGAPGEIGDLADAFDDMAARIERGEQLRRVLASDVAHELRTPLASLQASLEELRDGLAPASTERLASLHDQSLRLGRLVADLERLAEAESPDISVHLTQVDLVEEAEKAVHSAQSLLDSAGLTVTVHAQESVQVSADVDRVAQILGNLLSNVARYCRDGDRVAVHVRAQAGMGIVEVTDSGPGMTAEDATNAFERLYRGSQAPTVHGSGVGLSIVRALTTAQNGTVELTSTLGAGTTVRVALPLARTPE